MDTSNEHFCRSCLCQCESYESIFKLNDGSNPRSKAEIINNYIPSSFHIKEGDGYPKVICSLCSEKLIDFHNFMYRVQRVQEILQLAVRNLESDSILPKVVHHEKHFQVDAEKEIGRSIKQDLDSEEIYDEIEEGNYEIIIPKCEIGSHNNEVVQGENRYKQGEDNFKYNTVEKGMDWTIQNEFLHHGYDYKTQKCVTDINKDEVIKEDCDSLAIRVNQSTLFPDKDKEEKTVSGDDVRQGKNFTEETDWEYVSASEDDSDYDRERGNVYKYDFSKGICHQLDMKSNFVHRSATHQYKIGEQYAQTDKKRFDCKICDKKFARNALLQRHTLVHTGEKPFKCDLCDKRFTQESDMQRHLIIHSGKKSFECELCHNKYTRKSYLKLHILTHSDEKSLQCELCHKRFAHKGNLQRHLLTHNIANKLFKCDLCHREFARKEYLQKHLFIHSVNKSFECHLCDKKFARKEYLQKHLLTHPVNKSFECHLCDKKFAMKCILKRHLLSHKSKQSFECGICHKHFNFRNQLESHYNTLIHKKTG